MLKLEIGKIKKILRERNGIQELLVDIKDKSLKALNYNFLTGCLKKGEEILLNTTAQELNLGTGEYCFVIGSLSRVIQIKKSEGHIIKLRYTPYQFSVMSVEEKISPYRKKIEKFKSLDNLPVIIATLHSQIAPASSVIKKLTKNKAKISYIMTDSASLPLPLSNLVHLLKEKKIIDKTITSGQAFGGDYEAVNLYTALIFAKEVINSDVIIVSPGPGTVGTGTKYGFSAIEQGEIINAVSILGGIPIAVLRISFADKRKRHQGISHHNILSLGEISLRKAIIGIPMMDEEKMKKVLRQIGNEDIDKKHIVKIINAEIGLKILTAREIKVKTMGRTLQEDKEFFLSSSAAGIIAVKIMKNEENFNIL